MDISPVEQIKQKLDIIEVIGEYIRLSKAGRNYKARCPFHSERTPSFMISQERQIWHCFGCGLGGDIFAFVKQIEGVEFPDALRILARKAGVMLKRQDPQVQSQKKRLYDVCELATKFYEVQLEKSISGKKAQKYLLERGLKPQTIRAWRLGWAPDDWRALSDFLKKRGYKEQEILQSGLVVQKDPSLQQVQGSGYSSEYHDRFRSRIMFPIFDIQGQAVGFAGRIFGKEDADVGKYINTPQTPLYDKSFILYGLNFAKIELRQKNSCIFVEGNLDVIMSHQAGTKNTVASSGTALTDEHLKIIKRYTDNLIFAFDTDLAGVAATQRSIDMALKQDFIVKIAILGEKDPADLIKKSPAQWLQAIEQAQSVMDFYFASTFAKFNSQTLEGKREIKKVILPVVKSIASKTEQSEWIKGLARRLRVDEKDLVMDLQKIKITQLADWQTKTNIAASTEKNISRQDGLEERFLGLCLNNPQHFSNVSGIAQQDFQNEKLGQIFCELKKLIEQSEIKDPFKYLQKSLSAELKMQVEYLSLKIQQQPSEETETFSEMESCVRELKMIKVRQELTSLSYEIEQAQGQGSKLQLKQLLEKFSQLSSELIQISKKIK